MVVIRALVSKAGRVRLDVGDPSKTSLGDLRALIAKKLNDVAEKDIIISLDGAGNQLLIGDSRPINSWGITQDGGEVHVFLASPAEPSVIKQSASVPQAQGAQQQSPPPQEQKKEGHKYKTFEEYLTEQQFNVSQLPLSQSYAPIKRNLSGATKLPPSVTLKHQVYRHVDHVEVMNVAEVSALVQTWRSADMLVQRCGYLIGYYLNDSHYGPTGMRAVVEAVYEPPQTGTMDGFEIQENDSTLELVEKLARSLGLEMIGLVFTHIGRDKLIQASELLQMGRLQLKYLHQDKHYTDYPISTFVTLTVSPKESLKGEPGSDAFMVSDLGLGLIRDGIIIADADEKYVRLREPERNELLPTVLETTKEVSRIDTDWLLVRLAESAPKDQRCLLKRSTFPKTNKVPATFQDVQDFLRSGQALPAHEKLADFHFLVFIATALGFESAEQITAAIKNKTDIAEEFYVLLESLAHE